MKKAIDLEVSYNMNNVSFEGKLYRYEGTNSGYIELETTEENERVLDELVDDFADYWEYEYDREDWLWEDVAEDCIIRYLISVGFTTAYITVTGHEDDNRHTVEILYRVNSDAELLEKAKKVSDAFLLMGIVYRGLLGAEKTCQ